MEKYSENTHFYNRFFGIIEGDNKKGEWYGKDN